MTATEITSVLNDVIVEDLKTYKTNVYIDAQTDMPMGNGRNFVITNGHLTRALFESKGAPTCRSWDGYTSADGEKICTKLNEITGRQEPVCPFTVKDANPKCNLSYQIYLEHDNAEKQYVLKLNMTQRRALSDYVKKIAGMGLDVDKVITKITRIESPKGVTSKFLYKFEYVSELNLDPTEAEQKALNDIRAEVANSGAMSVEDATDLLMMLSALKAAGITQNRAKRLAESIAEEGIIRA